MTTNKSVATIPITANLFRLGFIPGDEGLFSFLFCCSGRDESLPLAAFSIPQ
jgi:hypothetical protein